MKLPLLLLPLLATALLARAELTEQQRLVPLEQEPTDPNATKIVLLAGSVSNRPGQHEYFAGCAMLADLLRQTPGVFPVLAAEGWPKNEKILEGAKAIVVYADGGAKLPFLAPERWALMKHAIDAKAGFVMLHQSVDTPPEHGDEMQSWLGAAFLPDIGCRGHWEMSFDKFPEHPVTRGVEPFTAPGDGWLFDLHYALGVIPLLRGAVPAAARTSADAKANPDRQETIAWAYERPAGGRSFGYTGCDLHRNWSLDSQRKLVVNGILWTAGLEIPKEGAPVALNPADLAKNMDAKTLPAAPPKLLK